MAKKPARRNPQDTTLRNTRAANKRLDQLARSLAELDQLLSVRLSRIDDRIDHVVETLDKIEQRGAPQQEKDDGTTNPL